jgi:hypothetical protein
MAIKPLDISRDLCSDGYLRSLKAAKEMGSLSILHWLAVLLVFGSPIMGIIRGVKNSSIPHTLLSVFIPAYGVIFFSSASVTVCQSADIRVTASNQIASGTKPASPQEPLH